MFIKFLFHASEKTDFQISEHIAIWSYIALPFSALMTKIDVLSPGSFDLVISLFLIWHSNGFGGFNAREMLHWNECHWFMPSDRLPESKLWGPFSSFLRACSASLNASWVNSGRCTCVLVCLCMCIKASSLYCLAWIVVMSAEQDDSRELMMWPKASL